MKILRIFICGVLPENSGKTTVAEVLTKWLVDNKFKVTPFKPLSAHSYWWQYDSYLENIKRNMLVSEDAIKLWKASESEIPIEIINPCDMLLSIPDYSYYGYQRFIKLILERKTFDLLAIGRFTKVREGRLWRMIYFKGNTVLEDNFLEKLMRKANEIIEVKSEEEFLNLHKIHYNEAVESCYNRVLEYRPDVLIIESFNDAVYPWRGIEECDLIIAVAPTVLLLYDKKEFIHAIHIFKDPYILEFHRIADLIEPYKVIKVKPLGSCEMKNKKRVFKMYNSLIEEICSML